MLRRLTSILFLVFSLSIKSAVVLADEVKDVLAGFEDAFSPELKYSLEGKVTQEDFPAELLDSFLADLEKALFEITDFKINLQLQNKLEKVWQDSIEFNNAEFEEIYSNAGFDRLILLELIPQEDAVELLLRVLDVGDDVGRVTFSSGSSTIPVDWDAINVATISLDEINSIRAELERLSVNFSTIDAASTFAEHLHNARIYLGSKNLSAAIQSYQQAINLNSNYADILEEYYQVLIARFGSEGAQRYLEQQLFPSIDNEIRSYFTLAFKEYTLKELQSELETKANIYPPLLSRIVWDQLPRFENVFASDNSLKSDYYLYNYIKLTASRKLIKSFDDTTIQAFFIDPLAVEDSVNYTSLVSIDRNINRVEVVPFDILVPTGSFNEAFLVPPLCAEFHAFEQRFFEGAVDIGDFDSIYRINQLSELLSIGRMTRQYERFDSLTSSFVYEEKEVILSEQETQLLRSAFKNCSNAAGLIYHNNKPINYNWITHEFTAKSGGDTHDIWLHRSPLIDWSELTLEAKDNCNLLKSGATFDTLHYRYTCQRRTSVDPSSFSNNFSFSRNIPILQNTSVCGGPIEINVEDFHISPIEIPSKVKSPSDAVEYLEYPITIERDRYLFAGVDCTELDGTSYRLGEPDEKSLNALSTISGIGSVLITDDVDVLKPIVFKFVTERLSSTDIEETHEIDIRKDGTFFFGSGFPLDNTYLDGDWLHSNFSNKWLYLPGIIQSSVMFDRLESVSYTTVSGIEKSIDNIVQRPKKHFSDLQPFRGELSQAGQNGFMRPGEIVLDSVSTGSRAGMSNMVFGITGVNSQSSEIFHGKMRRNAKAFCLGYVGGIEPMKACFSDELTPGFVDKESDWKYVRYKEGDVVSGGRIFANCITGRISLFDNEYQYEGWGLGEYRIESRSFDTRYTPGPMNYYLAVDENRLVSDTSMVSGWFQIDEVFSKLCPERHQRFASEDKFIPEVALTCWLHKQKAQITNVSKSTNFRHQPGMNQQIIGQIRLGETVTLVNPNSYLRTDRCASICEGSNQQSIKQCIDNNDVWIEVQYNGRRGFLSRKFLE